MEVNMIKVHNLNGTTDNKPPRGYESWKEWWEERKNCSFNKCSCSICISKAEVGAHVQKSGSVDKNWYIVPLCKSCNSSKIKMNFYVNENDLEQINI